MTRSRFVAISVLAFTALAAFTPRAFAAKAIPLTCNWAPNYSGFGVFDDGNATYDHNVVYTPGLGKVQCYFGVNARDVDMVTYNTGRKLHFVFDPSATAVKNANFDRCSETSCTFDAEVDLFGINYFGQFTAMGNGTTAQVQMDLEFHWPSGPSPRTFELDYSSLAVVRLDSKNWLISSEGSDAQYGPVAPSRTAKLNEIRRRGSIPFGTVDMPIRFTVTLK